MVDETTGAMNCTAAIRSLPEPAALLNSLVFMVINPPEQLVLHHACTTRIYLKDSHCVTHTLC